VAFEVQQMSHNHNLWLKMTKLHIWTYFGREGLRQHNESSAHLLL